MSKSFVELKLLPQQQDLSQFVTDRFLPAKGVGRRRACPGLEPGPFQTPNWNGPGSRPGQVALLRSAPPPNYRRARCNLAAKMTLSSCH